MSYFHEDDVIKVREGVHSKEVGDAVLVLTDDKRHVITLDDVSLTIWKVIADGAPFSQIVETVVAEYDVSAEVAKKDVEEWLKQAKKEKLIQVISRRD